MVTFVVPLLDILLAAMSVNVVASYKEVYLALLSPNETPYHAKCDSNDCADNII